jgi:hypothetical protein
MEVKFHEAFYSFCKAIKETSPELRKKEIQELKVAENHVVS